MNVKIVDSRATTNECISIVFCQRKRTLIAAENMCEAQLKNEIIPFDCDGSLVDPHRALFIRLHSRNIIIDQLIKFCFSFLKLRRISKMRKTMCIIVFLSTGKNVRSLNSCVIGRLGECVTQ